MKKSGALADLQRLSDALDAAYWAASTIEGKDTIRGSEALVDDAIIKAEAQAIEDRTAAFKRVAQDVSNLNKVLKDLLTEINQFVKNVKIAGNVIDTIAKILPFLV